MLTFVKLGGSVITNKTQEESPNISVIKQLAAELRSVCSSTRSNRTPQLVIGHGSGSFGHTYAKRYGVHTGLSSDADWIGFALTSAAALRLNRIVVDELLAAGVPALSLQPSATIRSKQGVLTHWDTAMLSSALEHGLLPVVHGDVAFDTVQGSAIISTEQLLTHLAHDATFQLTRIILVGEAGVYTVDPHLDPHAQCIPHIDSANITTVLEGTGASHGVDVTGGMHGKIALMWQLVCAVPNLTIQLIGPTPGLLTRAIQGDAVGEGTLITA
ncbi:MAG: isopentenyl phosphate kinase family protein [Chloroflexi bacterium AL-W]|nr:isopentenyl phosphate kinase family protein [Chloroflexi bacterium AL-N1]NOK70513.1 isopentenyl phosphate kinase family protein [Chloroflexi bacterium AL-N10]NOK78128.1 isopentenyl phosphate kinase family protein [Chloroflexi bacterium AL-N5]NOK85227.1 isopentenyl phosphate kinase family protein [Chloroflexi bacterium AL-W]NOK91992.1 isopentenyl phosphate kinase family protein [Chloroflexi bacterium AL-N15]